MKILLGSVALLSLALTSCTKKEDQDSKLKYYGTDSQKALLSFKSTVEFRAPAGASKEVELNLAQKAINNQVHYLFGSLKEHEGSSEDGVIDFTKNQGVPETKHTISNIVITPIEGDAGSFQASYDFVDNVAFSKTFLAQGPRDLKIVLPKDPATIYAYGLVTAEEALKKTWTAYETREIKKKTGSVNLCTDVHYNSEGDFWYFWNPYKKNCPSLFRSETLIVDARMEPMASTVLTYPEYARLNASGDVNIVYIVGPNEEKTDAQDAGRQAFEKAAQLLKMGKDGVNMPNLEPGMIAFLNSVKPEQDIRFFELNSDAYTKALGAYHNGVSYTVSMYLLHPHEETPEFRGAVRQALKESDILIYDGHSGLGENLRISRFFSNGEEMMDPNKYQTFFFNACSTFAYFNSSYFSGKKTAEDPNGTKNLDIVTTSIGAEYSIAASTDVVFLHSLVNGSYPSWQKIMDDVYAVMPELSALTQVNGDEDNSQTPPRP